MTMKTEAKKRYECVYVSGDYYIVTGDGRSFYCRACIQDMPLNKRSSTDLRYCTGCQEIIQSEYQFRADYKGKPLSSFYIPLSRDGGLSPNQLVTGPQNIEIVNSAAEKAHSLHFRTDGRPETYKKQELPEDLIKELHASGLGLKAIATKVRNDYGAKLSYQTVRRIIRGERKQLEQFW